MTDNDNSLACTGKGTVASQFFLDRQKGNFPLDDLHREMLKALEAINAEMPWIIRQLELYPDDLGEAENMVMAAIAKAKERM